MICCNGEQPTVSDVWAQPKAPSPLYFPSLGSAEVPRRGASVRHVDEYIATVWDHLKAALPEAQAQSTAEAQRQKWYYDQKIGAVGLKPGNLVLVKADTFQGKRKIMDRWEDKPNEVMHQIATDIPLYKVKDQQGNSCVLHCNWLLLMASEAGIPLCMGVCQVWDRCTRVTVRLCHKKMMVWQPPSIRLGRLPWGG